MSVPCGVWSLCEAAFVSQENLVRSFVHLLTSWSWSSHKLEKLVFELVFFKKGKRFTFISSISLSSWASCSFLLILRKSVFFPSSIPSTITLLTISSSTSSASWPLPSFIIEKNENWNLIFKPSLASGLKTNLFLDVVELHLKTLIIFFFLGHLFSDKKQFFFRKCSKEILILLSSFFIFEEYSKKIPESVFSTVGYVQEAILIFVLIVDGWNKIRRRRERILHE